MQHLTPSSAPFLGRAEDIAEIGALLDDPSCRLLTLMGPGGIGKTRLAVEVALRKRHLFPDGLFFVSLAPLSHPADILTAIANATPFRFQQDHRSPREQFLEYLNEQHAQRLLLVLDNVEHLLNGMAIVSEMLAVTSGLKILTTSREALNLQEEWVRHISGLAYPHQADGKPIEDYPAVQLFLDRARRIRGDFNLTEESRGVTEICRLVEGMPLAIELAVDWLKTLPPDDIAREIQHNLDILTTRSRNLPERHRTIRSVFSHSWRLMSEEERNVFQKLSIFRGGFTREAAHVVAGASLQTLARLIDKSLVRSNAQGRYTIHELLRQYGSEQIDATGQREMIQQTYIGYYLGLLQQLEHDIKTQRQIIALDTIEADFENVRSAWQMAMQQKQFVLLHQALESLHWFADMRGRYYEVVSLWHAALEQFPHPASAEQEYMMCRLDARLVHLILLGSMPIEHDLRAHIDACLVTARAYQEQAEIGFCLLVSGILAAWEAKGERRHFPTRAGTILQECLEVFEALEDRFYQADVLAWMAWEVPMISDETHLSGQSLLKQSLSLRREIGDHNGIAWITLNLSSAALAQLDYLTCERYARQALAFMRKINSVKGILQAMFSLAHTTMLRGELKEARDLAEHIRDIANKTGNLEGKMLSTGLLAFLMCVMDGGYTEGAALAQQNNALSLEQFFSAHDELSLHWGSVVADCALGHYEAARLGYASLFAKRLDDPGPATVCLTLEASARTHHGQQEEATKLLSLAFHQPAWVSGWLHHWPWCIRLRSELLHSLGEEVFQAAWEQGGRYNLETTIRSILGELEATAHMPPRQSLLEPLSRRELEVLALMADGLSNHDIAERLVLSVGTVKVHTRNIYSKLNVASRTQAIAQATRLHLL